MSERAIDPAYALCPHGNDFVWECPTCYSNLQSRYDRLLSAANLVLDKTRFMSISGEALSALTALDAETKEPEHG